MLGNPLELPEPVPGRRIMPPRNARSSHKKPYFSTEQAQPAARPAKGTAKNKPPSQTPRKRLRSGQSKAAVGKKELEALMKMKEMMSRLEEEMLCVDESKKRSKNDADDGNEQQRLSKKPRATCWSIGTTKLLSFDDIDTLKSLYGHQSGGTAVGTAAAAVTEIAATAAAATETPTATAATAAAATETLTATAASTAPSTSTTTATAAPSTSTTITTTAEAPLATSASFLPEVYNVTAEPSGSLIFQVMYLPPSPWPATLGGRPFVMRTQKGQGRTFLFPAAVNAHTHIQIARETRFWRQTYYSDSDLCELANLLCDYFQQHLGGSRRTIVTEVMFTNEHYFRIFLANGTDMENIRHCLPTVLAGWWVKYAFDSDLCRPSATKGEGEGDGNSVGPIVDSTARHTLRPGMLLRSDSNGSRPSIPLLTTTGILVRDCEGSQYMTAASCGIGDHGKVWLAQGQRKDPIGYAYKDVPFTGVGLIQLRSGVRFENRSDVCPERPEQKSSSFEHQTLTPSKPASSSSSSTVSNDITSISSGTARSASAPPGRSLSASSPSAPSSSSASAPPSSPISFLSSSPSSTSPSPLSSSPSPSGVRLSHFVPADKDIFMSRCYMDTPFDGRINATVVAKSARICHRDRHDRHKTTVYNWEFSGQEEGNERKVRPTSGSRGAVVCNEDGAVLGIHQYYIGHGPYSGLSASTSVGELQREGLVLETGE